MRDADFEANYARSRALPMFREGKIPPERDRSVGQDDSGFKDVLLLLIRSWPYIRPQLLGRWWYPDRGSDDRVADLVSGDGYRFGYAPFLVGLVAAIGPMSGWVPATFGWPMYLLYVPVATMVAAMFAMAFTAGRVQLVGTIALLLGGIGTNVSANFFIEGYASSLYGASVTVACIAGWMLQFRLRGGRIEYRVRIGAHLVYFYAINFTQRFIGLALGVILTDLLYQNLLQGEPLAPALAQLFGVPEWTQAYIDELTKEQRRELVWIYVYLALGSHLVQLPLRIINPYYNMWIMQRINQDLRIALLARWHQLSLSYHSEHRTGDSIYRIYQDSAMVPAVIGPLIGMTLAMKLGRAHV